MNSKILMILIAAALSLTSCAGLKQGGKSLTEDLGSPEKVALLKERVLDFWDASVKGDYERVYNLYDPFFRAVTPNKEAFKTSLGKVIYHKFELKDIVKVEGNVARVKVAVVYSVPKVMFKTREFSQPETPAEFQETWLYVYDNWYREFYMGGAEKAIAYY